MWNLEHAHVVSTLSLVSDHSLEIQIKIRCGSHFGTTNNRSFACDVIAAMLEDDNKRFLISSSNMAATSLSFESLGIDCKPSIGDFRVAFRLCFKASASAKAFVWKLVLFTRTFWFICV